MAILPLDQSIPRFQANEDRINVFANGDATTDMETSGGQQVPSIRKIVATKTTQIDNEIAVLLGDRTNHLNDLIDDLIDLKNNEINVAADGVLAGAMAARNKAAQWAENDVDVEVEAGEYSAKHYASKSADIRQQVADDLVTFTELAETLTELGTPWDETVGAQQIKGEDAAAIIAKLGLRSAEDSYSKTEVDEFLDTKGLPLGALIHSALDLTTQGYLLRDGSPITNIYPDLRSAFLAAGAPFGMSGPDPLLPNDMNPSRFIRSANADIPLGTVQDDQMQGHRHRMHGSSTTAAAGTGRYTLGGDAVNGDGDLELQKNTWVRAPISDGVNGTPRVGDETRPKSIAYLPYIKAFGAITIEGMADLAELLNAIASEASARLGENNTELMTPLRVRQATELRNSGTLSLSGTSYEITGIPAGVQRVFLDLDATISSGSAGYRLELGDASSFPASGYSGAVVVVQSSVGAAAIPSTHFQINGASGVPLNGLVILTKQSGNLWKVTGSIQYLANGNVFFNGKASNLAGVLTRLRISTGSAVTLGGTAKVWWEF